MGVKVTERDDGVAVYLIDFRDQNGRRVREPVGEAKTTAQRKSVGDAAVARLAQRRTEVRTGTFVNPTDAKRDERERAAREEKAAGPTFAEFTTTFLRDYAAHRRSDFYKDRLKVLSGIFGTRRMREVTKGELDAFAARRSRDVKASTIRRDLAVLRVVFKMAVRWGVLDSSPAVDLVGPSEPPHKTRFLSRDEWTRLDENAAPYLRPILRCAVLTGLRLREITDLRWEDYDKKAGTITLSGENKTASVRTVPLSPEARAVLNAQVRHVRCPHVFTNAEGKPYTDGKSRARISQNTRAAMKAAGINGASFHTLRHTAGTWMVQAKVPLYEVQRVLGHSTPVMTQRYANIVPDDLRGAVAALGAVFAGRKRRRGLEMDSSRKSASGATEAAE